MATRRSDIRTGRPPRRRANPYEAEFGAALRQGGEDFPQWLQGAYDRTVNLARQYAGALAALLKAHAGLALPRIDRDAHPAQANAIIGLILCYMRQGVEFERDTDERLGAFDLTAQQLEPVLRNAAWSQALIGQSSVWKLEVLATLGGALEMLVENELDDEVVAAQAGGLGEAVARIEVLRALAFNLPEEPEEYTGHAQAYLNFAAPSEHEFDLIADHHGDLGGAGARVSSSTREEPLAHTAESIDEATESYRAMFGGGR